MLDSITILVWWVFSHVIGVSIRINQRQRWRLRKTELLRRSVAILLETMTAPIELSNTEHLTSVNLGRNPVYPSARPTRSDSQDRDVEDRRNEASSSAGTGEHDLKASEAPTDRKLPMGSER